jgi:ubiquitin carboxyl-terminal hydrolase 5/13
MDQIERCVRAKPEVAAVATPHDVVYHSECCYTFHSPFTTPRGILVSLRRPFIGTVESMALQGAEPGTQSLFLRIVKECLWKHPKNQQQEAEEGTTDDRYHSMPTKLAIGVEGGFPATEEDQYETRTTYSIVLLEKNQDGTDTLVAEVPYLYPPPLNEDGPTVPDIVRDSVHSIIHHVGSATQTDLAAWQAEDEDIPVSKYAANLPFVDNGVRIDPNPATWKCQKTGRSDDHNSNLWLNLSDGFIGGGRRHWDVSADAMLCLLSLSLFDIIPRSLSLSVSHPFLLLFSHAHTHIHRDLVAPMGPWITIMKPAKSIPWS